MALGAGVWLVCNVARSAGNDAARGRARPWERGRPRIISIESETLSADPAHQDKLYRATYHAPGEAAGGDSTRAGQWPGRLPQRPGQRLARWPPVRPEGDELSQVEASSVGPEAHAGGDVPGAAEILLMFQGPTEQEPVDGRSRLGIGRRGAE